MRALQIILPGSLFLKGPWVLVARLWSLALIDGFLPWVTVKL